MLEEEILRLKRSETEIKFDAGSKLNGSGLKVNLECSHIPSVEVLSLLIDPVDCHLAGEVISDD